jgi:hypothetical protein
MSGGKFASLTSGLLVRKGEARPSEGMALRGYSFASAPGPHDVLERVLERPMGDVPQLAVVARVTRPPQPETHEEAETLKPPKCAHADGAAKPCESSLKPRRLMVSLSPGEHETLGLIAVKKGVTRHQLLRNALDEYLALLVEEYSDACSCIYSGCSCAAPA